MFRMASMIEAANARLFADGDLDAVGEFFTPDYVAHVTDQDMAGGHATVRRFVGMIRRAFPDIQVEIEILLEGKKRIAWQRTFRGTQQGAFMGFPARGRQMVWRDMVTSQFRHGLISEEWMVTDLAERLLLSRKP